MKPPCNETLFISVDRTASELLWSLTQLSAQPLSPALRERTAEILTVVISGLRHHLEQLNPTPKDTQS